LESNRLLKLEPLLGTLSPSPSPSSHDVCLPFLLIFSLELFSFSWLCFHIVCTFSWYFDLSNAFFFKLAYTTTSLIDPCLVALLIGIDYINHCLEDKHIVAIFDLECTNDILILPPYTRVNLHFWVDTWLLLLQLDTIYIYF